MAKRRLVFIGAVVIFFFSAGLFSKPAIIYFAEKQIEKTFPHSSVSVGGCGFLPLGTFSLNDIRIVNRPVLDVAVKSISFRYSPASLIKATLTRISVADAVLTIQLPDKSIGELRRFVAAGASAPVVKIEKLEVINARCAITAKEAALKAALSASFDMKTATLESCELAIDSLEAGAAALQACALAVKNNAGPGNFSVKKITFQNAALREIGGRPRLIDNALVFDDLSGEFLGGKVLAQGALSLAGGFSYELNVVFTALDLDRFVRDFKLTEKLALAGNISGPLSLKGSGGRLGKIRGNLSADKGGQLTIKDDTYLKGIAQNSGQSLDIIVESFNNYHYNTGDIAVSLDEGNLVFTIALEGQAGKRQLSVVLHDVIITQEEE